MGPTLPISEEIHSIKYRQEGESFKEAMTRVADALKDSDEHFNSFREILLEQRFLPAGRVQAAMGAVREVTPYNCFVSNTIPDSMDGSEDFWLQISTDGGVNYTTVKAWVNAVDFTNGGFFQDSVVISGYTLTDQTRLRFRCDASGNGDDIYLDEVRVSVK